MQEKISGLARTLRVGNSGEDRGTCTGTLLSPITLQMWELFTACLLNHRSTRASQPL